uniref:Uncharacterized protein n=1 Tax=Micrurus corallinus TaxID=54390 RepID=A0A2D4GBX5_MICCO
MKGIEKNNTIAPSTLFSVEKLSSHILTVYGNYLCSVDQNKNFLGNGCWPESHSSEKSSPTFPFHVTHMCAEEQGDFLNAQMASSNQTLMVDSHLRTPRSK